MQKYLILKGKDNDNFSSSLLKLFSYTKEGEERLPPVRTRYLESPWQYLLYANPGSPYAP